MKFSPQTVRCTMPSPVGTLTLVAHDTALVGVWFDAQQHLPALQSLRVDTRHPVLLQTRDQLEAYFAGQRLHFDIPLDFSSGTPFQQQVWRSLLAIAPGTTSTYGAISRAVGKPRAVRAVGGAVGRNPIGIIVPCHRVIGANGALTGYAGGLDRKVALLQREGSL